MYYYEWFMKHIYDKLEKDKIPLLLKLATVYLFLV